MQGLVVLGQLIDVLSVGMNDALDTCADGRGNNLERGNDGAGFAYPRKP